MSQICVHKSRSYGIWDVERSLVVWQTTDSEAVIPKIQSTCRKQDIKNKKESHVNIIYIKAPDSSNQPIIIEKREGSLKALNL